MIVLHHCLTEMTDCDDGDHRDQADLGEYDMIDNRQYRMPRSEMPEV